MYPFVCLMLLVSLEGLRAEQNSTTTKPITSTSITPTSLAVTSNSAANNPTSKTTENLSSSSVTATSTRVASQTNTKNTPNATTNDCIFNIKVTKDTLLFSIIFLLFLICLLLLVITCLVCKRGVRNEELVITKSSTITKRNSVNGGPSETDIMLKDCGSVNVEIETGLAEYEEPEDVGGAAAKVENQVSSEEIKNLSNESGEAVPIQEVEAAREPDQ